MAQTERKLLGKLGIGAAIATFATLIAWGLSSRLLERAELVTYDWRVRRTAHPSAPSSDIIMVSIDDDSVRRMAGIVGRWPWPRLAHATRQSGARAENHAARLFQESLDGGTGHPPGLVTAQDASRLEFPQTCLLVELVPKITHPVVCRLHGHRLLFDHRSHDRR